MDINLILQNDLHQAMKDKNIAKKRAIRLLMSSLKLAEVAKGTSLEEMEVMATVQKEIKTKKDTIEDAKKANRLDLIEESEEDIQILQKYLPKQLSKEELLQMAKDTVDEIKAVSARDMGAVMKVLLPKIAGRASNQEVSKAVMEILQNK